MFSNFQLGGLPEARADASCVSHAREGCTVESVEEELSMQGDLRGGQCLCSIVELIESVRGMLSSWIRLFESVLCLWIINVRAVFGGIYWVLNRCSRHRTARLKEVKHFLSLQN